MATPAQLFSDGSYFAGFSFGVVVVFLDSRIEAEAGAADTWTGILFRAHGSFTTGATVTKTAAFMGDSGFGNAFSDSLVVSGNFLQVFSGKQKFVVPLTAPAGSGDVDGDLKFTIGGVFSVRWFWVRAPRAVFGRPGDDGIVDNWFDLELVGQLDDPSASTQHSFTIAAPKVRSLKRVRGLLKSVVVRPLMQSSPMTIGIVNHVVKANSLFAVGRPVVSRAGVFVRVGFQTFVLGKLRVRVFASTVVSAAASVSVVNLRVFAAVKVPVGQAVSVRAESSVKVVSVRTVRASVKMFVSFINVESLKTDMQIQFGADTRLETEVFDAVPVISGVVFLKNLKFALLQPGSESVRRLTNPDLSAGGLYGIDYTQGRFAWFGPAGEQVEVVYRHSVSRITDENLTAAIRKASLAIKKRLKAGVDVRDVRFIRGAVELAMSFLMDSAVWNAVNNTDDFEGQSKRIEFLNIIKRDLENRAHETLSPFLTVATAGPTPHPLVAVRSAKIR